MCKLFQNFTSVFSLSILFILTPKLGNAQLILPAVINSNITYNATNAPNGVECLTDCIVTNNATLIIIGCEAQFRGNLKIDGNATVKFFNSTVKMAPNREIYVNYGHNVYGPNGSVIPAGIGGTLVSDHSTITCIDPTAFWTGIRGYAHFQQGTMGSGIGFSGNVFLKGGTVEKAVIAFKNLSVGNGYSWQVANDPTHIFAEGTTFRNNLKYGLDMAGYIPVQGMVITGGIYNPQVYEPCLDLLYSSSAKFTNCTFEYTSLAIVPNCLVNLVDCKSIQFLSCNFKGIPINNPFSDYAWGGGGIRGMHSTVVVKRDPIIQINPTFDNLSFGIDLYDRNDFYSRTVIRDVDFKCEYGIILNNSQKALIANNRFTKRNALALNTKHIGLTLQYSTGYRVEANRFDYEMQYNDTGYVAMVVRESGTSYNEIYRNYFRKTNYGVQAIGQNRNQLGTNGLRILCNNFAEDAENVHYRYDISVVKDPKAPPINTPPQGIHQKQLNDLSLAASIDLRSAANRFNQQPNPNPGSVRHYFMESGASLINNFEYSYHLDLIQNNLELPIYRNFQYLQTRDSFSCPTKAIGVIPAFTSTQIENWQSKLSALETQISIAQIEPEANIETLSTLYYQHGLLIDSVLDRETDTLARKAILELITKNYQYKVDLASLYADDLDFDRAMHILQTEIPAQFNLQKEEQDALDHLAELYEVEQQLYVTGADWVNLAENVKDNVHNIANLGEPYAGGKAMELLARFEGMVFQPDYVRIVEEQTTNQKTKLAMNEWGLYPNPGKNTVHIEWFGKAAHLELRDITGRLVMAKDLKAGEDNFDASAFAPGIYLARLNIDGVQKNAIKFVKE